MTGELIALLVLLVLCFAWACIATGVALAEHLKFRYSDVHAAKLEGEKADLLLQLSARNAGEYAAAKHVAMRPYAGYEQDDREWTYDETGLIRMPAAPLDSDTE